ncbi:hypothetical protein [Vulcanisaeta moutnovskia]|uniref:hypothetical protein n=1 Tax=Vulcanisaeta moutnovskia TaxID=985052 RepID=UPI0006944255|nr:hypothetical protein [Vulcanisaeta moutnovskia]
MGFTANDLFNPFNSDYIGRISGVKASVNAVLGPPVSGKCFLIKSYIGNALETIIGFENLKPVSACGEYEVVEGVTKEIKASAVDRLVNFLVDVFPRVKAFMETKPIDAAISELKEHGFSDVELELLRKYFSSINRVPRQLIRQLIKLKVNHGLLIPYSIPWDVDEKYSLSGDVREVVGLIKNYFSRGIKWLGVNYIPPGLVKDVVDILRDPGRGRGEAEEYVKRQADAYYEAVKLLVGERDFEPEGLVARGFINFINKFGDNGLKYLVNAVLSGLASIVLSSVVVAVASTLIYQLTKGHERRSPSELIELGNIWQALHPSLRRLIASKVAIQVGMTPREAEDAINQLTGLKEEQLRQLIEDVRVKLEELEKRVEELGREVDLIKDQVKGPRIYGLNDVADGLLNPNVRLVGDDLGIVSEAYGRAEVNIVKAGRFGGYLGQLVGRLKEGHAVLIGPRGVGKSTLEIYTIWGLLREGDYYGVIRVEELTDPNARLILKNFLRRYSRDFANVFGRLLILYDPSPPEVYTSPEVRTEIRRAITRTVEQLAKLINVLNELNASLIIVLPSDLYRELSAELREDAKAVIERFRIDVDLRDEEFLKSIIREYSNCNIDEGELSVLVSEVSKFNEGYTLIARLIGEWLRRNGCRVEDVRGMVNKAHGDALAFIVNWINHYLGIFNERGEPIPDRIKALAEVLAIREAFKPGLSPGQYIATPYLIKRLVDWSYEVGLSDELANWLALRHEDLIEDILTRITKAVRGEEIEGTEYLRNALNLWRSYGKINTKINSDEEHAIDYIIEKYGNNLRSEFLSINQDCWDVMVLTLSAVLIDYQINFIIDELRSVGLSLESSLSTEDYNRILQYVKLSKNLLDNPRQVIEGCDALKLLISESVQSGGEIGFEVPLMSKKLLLMRHNNPILEALLENRRGSTTEILNKMSVEDVDLAGKLNELVRHRDMFSWEEIKEIAGVIRFIEGLYVIGLGMLVIYAQESARGRGWL